MKIMCGHCDARIPSVGVLDCAGCGERKCARCRYRKCWNIVTCSCGKDVYGHAAHYVDGVTMCDECDPIVQCEHGPCKNMVRMHEMVTGSYAEDATGWHEEWLVCPDCSFREICEDCEEAA